ncbi:putative heterogeneous nuclear ribonucleoprotein Q acidic [Helianthus annuus]|nr:putative heterogeneous nuclear ribonucleoprotein Q acidic [Helianthus annuus]
MYFICKIHPKQKRGEHTYIRNNKSRTLTIQFQLLSSIDLPPGFEQHLKMNQSVDHNSTDNQNGSKGVEVFVGGLARSVTEDKVHKVFSTCGEIMDIRLIKDQTGGLKGFGFVRFTTKVAAEKAMKELNESMLEGKKIGVLPSASQVTLFIGNLNKGWSNDDFNKAVRQVFPDVVSIDLSQPSTGGEAGGSKKLKNRGFGFVKFSSHAAASRAFRVGSKPGFVLGDTLHPTVKWAEEDAAADPDELAKIKIAFVRNLPSSADENYLKLLFEPFGKVEKVVIHNNGTSIVGFIHFAERSHLDSAIGKLNEKFVSGPKGSPSFKLQVEVARPMDKKRKRVYEDPQISKSREILSNYKPQIHESVLTSFNGHHKDAHHKEPIVADPHEAAVLQLPVAVRDRLLRVLRLGIATRYDIEVESLTSLAEIPESAAILVLDQFMISGADKLDKRAYLTSLISKHQGDRLGLNQLPFLGSHLSANDSLALHVDPSVPRSDSYVSRYSSLYPDYRLPSHAGVSKPEETNSFHLHEFPGSSSVDYSRYLTNSNIPTAYGNMEEMSPNPSHQIPTSSSIPYPKPAQDVYQAPPYAPSGDGPAGPATRPQMRFDPFTGQPYKFDPFTGEPIVPESAPSPYERYRL